MRFANRFIPCNFAVETKTKGYVTKHIIVGVIIKNINIMSKFTDGLKKGAGCAIGGALALGVIGFVIGGPAGAVALGTKGLLAGGAAGAGGS